MQIFKLEYISDKIYPNKTIVKVNFSLEKSRWLESVYNSNLLILIMPNFKPETKKILILEVYF